MVHNYVPGRHPPENGGYRVNNEDQIQFPTCRASILMGLPDRRPSKAQRGFRERQERYFSYSSQVNPPGGHVSDQSLLKAAGRELLTSLRKSILGQRNRKCKGPEARHACVFKAARGPCGWSIREQSWRVVFG